ncbi:MAG: replication-associated recombination protein A [Planctomycetota bacterium]
MAGLFEAERDERLRRAEPLAVRMRPRTLAEFVGQEHFLGEGKLLRRMLDANRIASVLFHGPPGTGKTTLAEVIATSLSRPFEGANAASIGVREIRAIMEKARERLAAGGKGTILFLDEIHRFSKSQQDVLLADVERGIVTLIGATTENPFFSVNSALVSRSQIFQFEPLSEPEITLVLRRALCDSERGLGRLEIEVEDEAIALWARLSDGDARRALTALEVAAFSGGAGGKIVVDAAAAEESIQRKAVRYDATGDEHYDVASAFIKSMRGSDPDATVYWLARMLVAGEDPRFIARRIAISASEEIGNADPRAILVASAACEITERVGLPECRLTLAQAAIYMACAPKSNASTRAILEALDDVAHQRTVPVPKHLRDGHYPGAKQLGHGTGYQSAHDSGKGWVDQEYLGVDRTYYVPTDRGHERWIRKFLAWLKEGGAAQGETTPMP